MIWINIKPGKNDTGHWLISNEVCTSGRTKEEFNYKYWLYRSILPLYYVKIILHINIPLMKVGRLPVLSTIANRLNLDKKLQIIL